MSADGHAACIEQGERTIYDLTYQGAPAFCQPGSTCGLDGICIPTPECEPGLNTGCSFRPSDARGRLLAATVDDAGQYLYWIEAGTFDHQHNYVGGGSIARVRLGEWQREELVTGLELFVHGDYVAASLRVMRDLGFVRLGDRSFQFALLPGAELIEDEVDQSTWIPCVDGDWQYWIHRPLQGAPEILRRTFGATTAGELLPTPFQTYFNAYESCLVFGDALYSGEMRMSLSSFQIENADEVVVGRYGDGLVGARFVLGERYLATATTGDTGKLEWRNVMRLSEMFYAIEVRGRHAYWKVPEPGGRYLLVRAALDGSSERPEIIDEGEVWSTHPTENGLVWIAPSAEEEFPLMHFIPLAP